MKRSIKFLVALAVAAGCLMPVQADAAKRCTGVSGNWTCISTGSPRYSSQVAERMPLRNGFNRAADFECKFTRSISRSWSTTTELSESLQASVWVVAEASVSGTQSKKLEETTQSSSEAGIKVRLESGERAICRRLYGSYSMPTTVEMWSNYKLISKKTFTTVVPYDFSVDLIRG